MEPQLAGMQRLLRALRALEGPSPAARGPPGYLRAFTAEAAPQAVEVGAAAGEAAATAAAATVARYDVAAGRLGPVAHAPGSPRHGEREDHHNRARLSSFLGLTDVLAQQQAQLAAGALGGERGGGMSTALRAMTWHQRHMDDTPAGRELRRNWQRQIILETKALEATRARYQKEALSAIARGQAAALPEARQMLLRWFGPMAAAVRREQHRVRRAARCGWARRAVSRRLLDGTTGTPLCVSCFPHLPLAPIHTHTHTRPRR